MAKDLTPAELDTLREAYRIACDQARHSHLDMLVEGWDRVAGALAWALPVEDTQGGQLYRKDSGG